ncbi:MAG TPA: protein kinase [Stellaceae bacterium]|nr:protein kinase [Stellaceae bacterium]
MSGSESDSDRTVTPTETLRPGTVVINTYKIEELIGTGGMGAVYRAKHVALGTDHAIKSILPELARDATMMRLFREEARKHSRTTNDAIVQYQHFVSDERGAWYLVMEFVDGDSLEKILAQRRFDPSEVRALLYRLAQGLAAAHDIGITHRDISPGNIILPGGSINRAKLIDFGIAKSSDPADMTVIGSDFAGKYSYVSPEQAGLYGGTITQSSDIYSLGLVLAAAALGQGRKIDMGGSLGAMVEARKRVPDLSEIPSAVRPIIEHMLQPDPKDRPPDMRALMEEARGASQPAPAGVVVAPPSRSRWPIWAFAGVAAAVAVVAGVVMTRRAEPSIDQVKTTLAATFQHYGCSDLNYAVTSDRETTVSGFVAKPEDIDSLRQAIADVRGIGKLDFLVKLRIWPFCDAIATLKRFQSPEGPRTPVLSLAAADGQAHVGSPLRVDVRAPPFDSYVYVDYFTAKGEVVHLLPNDKDAIYLRPARNNFVLGRFPMAGCWPLAGDPGQGLITLVASSDRLFPTPRPPAENAKDYLPELARLLAGANAQPIAATTLMFNLRPGDTAAAERCPAG